MSLTSFLKDNKDVRERFRREFQMPKLTVNKDLLAPPLTKRYCLIGTAFDYLLRFYIKHLNPDAITKEWIAECLFKDPFSPIFKDANNIEMAQGQGIISFTFTETDLTIKVKRIIEQAKKAYLEYLSSGKIIDELIESALLLAQLDYIYRSKVIDKNIGIIHKEDVTDLRNLISIIDSESFKAQGLCLLNPTFNEGSHLVGGADADLVIDDVIIDIKTTKKLELQRPHFDQLIGYYILYEISGIGDFKPKPKIKKIAIYFSRYAHLYILNLEEIIDKHNFPQFIHWFKDRAKSHFNRRHITRR